MKNRSALILIILCAVLSVNIRTYGQSYEHFTSFASDTTSPTPQKVAFDNSGNAYFTFHSYVSSGNSDPRIGIYKVNSAGQVVNAAYYQYGTNPYLDEDVISMLCKGSELYLLIKGYNPVTGSDEDMVLVKFNASLNVVWTRSYNSPGNLNDVPVGLANGPAGSVVITGNTNGKILTRRYSVSGQLMFSAFYQTGPSKPDFAMGISCMDNAIYVCGARMVNGEATTEVLKYTDSLQMVWLYANRLSGAGIQEYIVDFEVDTTGNVYVAGQAGSFPFIVKIGVDGTKLWGRKLTSLSSHVNGLFTDKYGDPFMWLHTSGSDRYYQLDKNLGTIKINKPIFAGTNYKNFDAYQATNKSLIIVSYYSDVQNVWNPWCQCFEDMLGYGNVFAKVNSAGNIVWTSFTPLEFDQWLTKHSPSFMAVNYNEFFYMGQQDDLFNFTSVSYFGAASTVSGLRSSGNLEVDSSVLVTIVQNPVKDRLQCQLTASVKGTAHLTIHDISGREYYKNDITFDGGLNDFNINVEMFSDGVYLMSIQGLDSKKALRFTKQH